jgi:hypothetical protein
MTIGLRNRKTIYKAFLTILNPNQALTTTATSTSYKTKSSSPKLYKFQSKINPLLAFVMLFLVFQLFCTNFVYPFCAKTTGGKVPQGALPRCRG